MKLLSPKGWSYSQQSNLYLKKAALYSLENPRILWSCQPLISKGSLADRDLDLSYGARELWFWHQICRYYTVCHHVEAYTLGRLSIDGFSFERVAQFNLEWIFCKLESGFQSLVGFRILRVGFRIPLKWGEDKFLPSLTSVFLCAPAGQKAWGAQICLQHFNSALLKPDLSSGEAVVWSWGRRGSCLRMLN